MEKTLIISLFILSICTLFACEKQSLTCEEEPGYCIDTVETTLVGEWKLIEYCISNGATCNLQSINSSKIITFSSNGIISSNSNLCTIDDNITYLPAGSPEFTASYTNDKINVSCDRISYFKTGNTLMLNYFGGDCPIKARYIKL